MSMLRRAAVRAIWVASFILGLLIMGFVPEDVEIPPVEKNTIVFDFDTPDQLQPWLVVNDGVMGGVSQSQMALTPQGSAIFRGTVSLENNGGFASIRTYPREYNLANYRGLILHVRGDGQRYKFRLRTNNYLDGIAYQTEFQTRPDTWQTILMPFNQFVPVFRGAVVADAPKLDRADIAQMGFMISDKQAGPFELEIDWIKAYK